MSAEITAALRAPSFEQDSAWHDAKAVYATKPRRMLDEAAARIEALERRQATPTPPMIAAGLAALDKIAISNLGLVGLGTDPAGAVITIWKAMAEAGEMSRHSPDGIELDLCLTADQAQQIAKRPPVL